MSVTRIASRYAKSLIDLAQDQGNLDRVKEDVLTFDKAVTESRDLYLLLKSPIIHADKKKQVLKALFEKGFDKTTMAFLEIITSKGREPFLHDIAREFMAQYKKIRHISTVFLRTARALPKEVVEQIRKKLEESTETDTTVEIITEVDPDLIGGFVAEFDNKRYDASVAHQLEQLKKDFSQNLFSIDL
jgi:F-type H+-transporting ATPase subunit delta